MRRLVVFVAVVAVLASCSGDDDDQADDGGAGAFAVQNMRDLSDGKYGVVWDSLHPAQQALVARSHFIDCASREPFDLDDVDVVDTFPEHIDLPGTGLEVESTAVSLRLSGGGERDTVTQHYVQVDGRWRWMLGSPADYEGDRCPGDPPPVDVPTTAARPTTSVPATTAAGRAAAPQPGGQGAVVDLAEYFGPQR